MRTSLLILGGAISLTGCDNSPKGGTSARPMNPPAAWEGANSQLSDDQSVSLFDGSTMDHWQKQTVPGLHGTGGNWGIADDGSLFGEQDPPGSGNGGLLLTKEKYGEFELEISMRPDWGPCSGIFLRTDERGFGWQIYVDHHDNGNVGHVRLETKPYSVPFRPFKFSRIEEGKPALKTEVDERTAKWPEGVYEFSCSAKTFLSTWRPDDWNDIRIRCTGETALPVIEIWINDERICKFNATTSTHPDFDPEKTKAVVGVSGHIGLQVHKGNGWPNGARVFWKDIRITNLDGETSN